MNHWCHDYPMQAKESKGVTENPFMGWEGWPPTSVVVVTLVLGLIFEVVFCIGFWQFWCVLSVADSSRQQSVELLIVSPLHRRTSGDTEELVDVTAEATSDAAEEAASAAEDILEDLVEDPLLNGGDSGASASE